MSDPDDESTSATCAMDADFAAAARGDEHAFARLMGPLVPQVLAQTRRMSRRLARADAEAEDLVQRVLEVAWRRLPEHEFRGERAFRAWVFQLARNIVGDRVKYLRGKGRDLANVSLDPRLAEVAADVTSVPGRVARAERLLRLRAALADLPTSQREVVEQHLMAGRTLREIASAMGISKNAVWERLQRGLVRLRDILRGELR